MPALSVMIKPASGACNLRCRYCFYADEMSLREDADRGIMSTETLENVISKALETARGSCTFAFQGGEPTLAGLEFFRTAVELEKKHNARGLAVHNALQTNGTLIDRDWAGFLAENGFLTGLSLDGGKDIHDLWRTDVGGNGTFTRVMRAAQLLNNAGAQFNILSVVTGQGAKRIGQTYGFLRKNGFDHQQYITCLAPLGEGVDASPTPDELGDCLCRLFDIWYADAVKGKLAHIRLFDNLLDMLCGAPPESCNMGGRCGVQYVVESDGRVYPCDFYAVDEWILGDINTDSFADLDRRREELGFIAASLPVPEECRKCRWYPLCRNGCRRERETAPDGSAGKNIYCESWKRFLAYSVPRLNSLLYK